MTATPERTDTGIEAVYTRLEAAERELAQIRTHHVQTLNTLGKTYSNLTTALDTLSRFKVEYEAVQDDLKAARTASELAVRHREASDDLIREMERCVNTLREDYPDDGMDEHIAAVHTSIKELLSEDDLTPSKTEQFASLVKDYEYFVVEYFTTKDSKAEAARDMLTAQYNRLLGEVTA